MRRSCRISLITLGEARLPRCDQTPPRQFMPGFPKTGSPADRTGYFADHEVRRALLDVRLKIVRRIMIAAMALFLLTLLGLKKSLGFSRAFIVLTNSSAIADVPPTARASSRLVCTVISFTASSVQWAMVRTLWPTSSPISITSHPLLQKSLDGPIRGVGIAPTLRRKQH